MAHSIRVCLFGLVLVGSAWSCAVCTGGQTEEVQSAYIWITVLLSLLPIFAFGGFAYVWKKKLSQQVESEEETLDKEDQNG